MRLTTEQIQQYATQSAVFMRTVLAEGIPVQAATQLTSSFLSSLMIVEASGKEPREPWEGNG